MEESLFRSVTVIDILISAAVLVGAFVIVKTATAYLKRNLKNRVSDNNLTLLLRSTRYAILLVALLLALPHLGINLSALLVAGGVTGIIIGFASQKIVSNLISGIFLMIEKPIKIGQWININEHKGSVVDMNIMSTIIRTFESLYVRIPNETVFTGTITNYAENIVRRITYTVGIRYSDDAHRAIDIIKEVIGRHPLALARPEPQAFVDTLGDNSVNITVRVWAPTPEWFNLRQELLYEIKQSLEEGGIRIPFPQRTIWFAEEDKNCLADIE